MASFLASDTAKLEALIRILTIVMTIGKYLPVIVAAFAVLNISLAILSFVVWNSILMGIVNALFGLGGLVFLGQLLSRRNIHRYEYRYKGRHLRKPKLAEETVRQTTNPDAYSA